MGSVLQGQKTGSEYILYLHDENGNTYGFLLKNGTTSEYYYYIFNAQGDVIGILDANGTKVVEYTYSAWGEVLSVTGTLASTIGQSNPIRYRGYYYDNETGFYYLQSRYYDPTTQRFLNADSYVSTGQGILGDNMFAYCLNNPINMRDVSGCIAETVKNIINGLGDLANGIGESVANVCLGIVDAMSSYSTAFFGIGSVALVDGPAPIGDTVAAVCAIALIGVCVIEAVYNYTRSSSTSIPKIDTEEKDVIFPKDKQRFPLNPYDFSPIGLVMIEYSGTSNGKIIKWFDPSSGNPIFEWNEDLKNGAHYHVMNSFDNGQHNGTHYYAGQFVPEPWNTLYF